MKSRIYKNFFTGLEEHAHDVVREAIKFVEQRKSDWVEQKDDKNIETINKIISYFIDRSDPVPGNIKEREREVFEYFCASVVYAEVIKHSYLHQKEDLAFSSEIVEKVSLKYLNTIAEKICEKLMETVHLHYADIGKEHGKSPNEIEEILKKQSGRLASRQSRGNIPFLTVYKDKRAEVSLRRGIELYLESSKDESYEVTRGDENLNNFPVRVYHNEYHSETSVGEKDNLKYVVKNDYVRNKLFRNKHITWIHKSAVEYNRSRTLYQIDLIDERRIRSKVPDQEYQEKLEKIVGRDSIIDPRNGTSAFKQEDLLISFFASELFQYDSHDITVQELEDYSDKLLKRFVVEKSSKMFLGFCFPTLQDCGHSNPRYATGSNNVLLLALIRGLTKFLFNITNQDAVYNPEEEDQSSDIDSQPGNSDQIRGENIRLGNPDQRKERIDEVCFEEKEDIGRCEITQKSLVHSGQFYLGSNSSGIIVEAKIAKPLLTAFVLLMIVVLLFSIIFWVQNEEEMTSVRAYVQEAGTILELWASIAGLFILIVKAIFPKWDFTDMIHSRRRCRSLTELIGAMKGNNKMEKKDNAIKLCSTVPKPHTVFSYYKSCAFTNNGNGEFHIDDDIKVFDLGKADYKFGVTFYGAHVVAEPRGIVRNLYIRSRYDTKTFHIAKNHKRQFGYIFCLPTFNKFVGSRETGDDSYV